MKGILEMAETVYDRAKRTGFISGPRHAWVKRMDQKPVKESKTMGKVVLRAGEALDNRRSAIQSALRSSAKKAGKDGDIETPWIKEISDDIVIYECPVDGTTKAASYSIEDGEASLGDPFDVEMQYAKL